MSNTITKGTSGLSILFDGSTAFDLATIAPDGLVVESLEFKPTATDDFIIVRELTASGRLIFSEKAATEYDNKIKYFNTERSQHKFKIYVVGNEASSGCYLIIQCK